MVRSEAVAPYCCGLQAAQARRRAENIAAASRTKTTAAAKQAEKQRKVSQLRHSLTRANVRCALPSRRAVG